MNRKSFVYNSMLGLGGSLIVGDSMGSTVPHENDDISKLKVISTSEKRYNNEA